MGPFQFDGGRVKGHSSGLEKGLIRHALKRDTPFEIAIHIDLQIPGEMGNKVFPDVRQFNGQSSRLIETDPGEGKVRKKNRLLCEDRRREERVQREEDRPFWLDNRKEREKRRIELSPPSALDETSASLGN